MNIWQTLEIEETKEKAKIQQAYAGLLKKMDIAKQPAEFQKLKQAYDNALAYINENKAEDTVHLFLNKTAFIRHLEIIEQYSLFWSRSVKWDVVFADTLEWTLDELEANQVYAMRFLNRYYPLLPKLIIQLFFDLLNLDKMTIVEAGQNAEVLQFIYRKELIKQAPSFSYDELNNIPEKYKVAFFLKRYDLWSLYNQKPRKEIFMAAYKEVMSIYDSDLDVENIYSLYLIEENIRLYQEGKPVSFLRKEKLSLGFTSLPINNTSIFLYYFDEAIRLEKLSKNGYLFLQKTKEFYLPHDLGFFMLGLMYWYDLNHTKADEVWQRICGKDYQSIITHVKKGKRKALKVIEL